MYDHIGLKVKDLAASRRFYEAALAPLAIIIGRAVASKQTKPSFTTLSNFITLSNAL